MCASVDTGYALKQAVSIFIGVIVYVVMLAVLRRSDIVSALRTPVAVFAVALLILNIVLAKTTNGTLNWIEIQGISIQPSEIVKVGSNAFSEMYSHIFIVLFSYPYRLFIYSLVTPVSNTNSRCLSASLNTL